VSRASACEVVSRIAGELAAIIQPASRVAEKNAI
jgi:hypothetical protein